MTVTVNASTENVRTLTTSPQTFSHGGAASGVKGVVLALVHGTSSTDHVSAASYGGVAMARIQRNTDTSTEPGAAELWFLGAGVPQGTQTVSYTPGLTTDDFHAVVTTLLGADDLEVVDQDGLNNNVANPSVTLQYGGRTCMAFAALYGGGADGGSFTPNANCTTVHDHDLGAFYSEVIRQTTAGSSDFAIGGTSATDDVAFAAIAVSELLNILTGSGAPQAATATASGSGTNVNAGSGTTQAATATADGAAVTTNSGQGTAQADIATTSGAGVVVGPIAGSGSPQADSAIASGVVVTTLRAAGAAQAQPATASATGNVIYVSFGTPQAERATATGSGAVIVIGSNNYRSNRNMPYGRRRSNS